LPGKNNAAAKVMGITFSTIQESEKAYGFPVGGNSKFSLNIASIELCQA
jgi:hypothetical protein